MANPQIQNNRLDKTAPGKYVGNRAKQIAAVKKKAAQYQGNSGVLDAPGSKVGKAGGVAANAYTSDMARRANIAIKANNSSPFGGRDYS